MMHQSITAAAADAHRSDLYARADHDRLVRAAREGRRGRPGRSVLPRRLAAGPASRGWLRRLRSKEAEELA